VETRTITSKPEKRPHCYICGAIENLTDDHLQTIGFFHPDDAKDLITAPLCSKCHRPLAKDDEIMRMWMSADSKASARGKWIFQTKIVRSTIPRSPKLLENIQPYLKPFKIGSLSGAIFNMPQSRAIPFIRRLTKGLLYTLYPDYDYFPDYFSVSYELPAPKTLATIKKLTSALSPLQRGEGTFQVWHGITIDTGDSGAWVYVFYEAVCFFVYAFKKAKLSAKISSRLR